MSKANIANQGFHTNPERINRKGRPKKLPELDQLMIELLGEQTGGMSRMREMLASLIELAIGGNIRAADIILTRAYGKPRESIDITTNGKDLAPDRDKNTLLVSPGGVITDIYGNYICDLPANKAHMFQHQIVFVDSGIRDSGGNITSLPPELMTDDEIQGDDGKRSFVGF